MLEYDHRDCRFKMHYPQIAISRLNDNCHNEEGCESSLWIKEKVQIPKYLHGRSVSMYWCVCTCKSIYVTMWVKRKSKHAQILCVNHNHLCRIWGIRIGFCPKVIVTFGRGTVWSSCGATTTGGRSPSGHGPTQIKGSPRCGHTRVHSHRCVENFPTHGIMSNSVYNWYFFF